MQSSTSTGFIVRSEWRWVTLVSLTLLAVAFSPFLLVALRNNPEADWRFMGLLHRYHDGVTYLAREQQGAAGLWLVHFQYTPEPHRSALVQPLYTLLGQISRLVMLSPAVIFHLARMLASFFMYMALYHLAASIWLKVRTRRIFFVFAAISSGSGWLIASLTGAVDSPDLNIPQAFPFFSSITGVHYPLATGCLAILAAVLIWAFRPGVSESPGINNGGGAAVLMSLALAFLYPETLIPIGVALAVSVAAVWYRERRLERELRWALWVGIPALPVMAYYLVTIRSNPAVAEWVQQKALPAPAPLTFIIGLGLPLLIALPGIYRAARRFERDGDRFMVLWLLTIVIGMYLPVNIHREIMGGLMIPVAYFAARSTEDVWFEYVRRRQRRSLLYILAVPLLALSNLYVLFVPIIPLLDNYADGTGLALEPDYVAAFEWLDKQVARDDVILAAPDAVSAWLPVWTKARVVYGHYAETLEAPKRYQEVLRWYRTTNPAASVCDTLLAQDNYRVTFVLDGPRERQIGTSACLDNLYFAASFGQVNIYATDR